MSFYCNSFRIWIWLKKKKVYIDSLWFMHSHQRFHLQISGMTSIYQYYNMNLRECTTFSSKIDAFEYDCALFLIIIGGPSYANISNKNKRHKGHKIVHFSIISHCRKQTEKLQLCWGRWLLFSSPEPKARVSYCHSAPSVVRPSVRRPSGVNFHIFDFSSETAERNSTKLYRKQDLNALYQVCVFRADRKNKMAALASDWRRHFRLLLWNH